MERMAVGEISGLKEERIGRIDQIIKYLGMELQRHNPSEWNSFLTACLSI